MAVAPSPLRLCILAVGLALISGLTPAAVDAADPAPFAASDVSIAAPRSVPAPVVEHGSRLERTVALTFDDGWDPRAVRAIGRILRAEGVPATFFPYGIAVRRAPDVWREIAAAGFPIGNHTQSHRDLARLPDKSVRAQLRSERRTVEPIIGRPMIPYLRPPYGSWTSATARVAAADGYRAIVTWDVDSRDWSRITPASIVRRATHGGNGAIVLLHAGPPATVAALPAIIAAYRARGFSFVTVPGLLDGAASPAPLPLPPPSCRPGACPR